jgi:1D-myo-inositol-tetrakisphosphate 5-kinase/inositol-polyphosphate multikinase
MGRQTFEPTANYDKISRELKKYPYQEEIGFRITGMKIWDETKQNYHAYDKHFGRSLLPDSVLPALAMFFHNGLSFRVDIIQEVIQKLKTILIWMKNQSYFKFFCSSILIVYDGLISSSPSSLSPHSISDLCQVKMIDFAHVIVNHHHESSLTSHPIWLESPTTSSSVRDDHSQDLEQPKDMIPTEVDEGYIHGLTRLIDFLSFLQTTLIINNDDKDNDNNQDSSSSNRHYQQSLQQKFTEFSSFQL